MAAYALIAEPDPGQAQLYRHLAQAEGFEVRVVRDGEQGREALRAFGAPALTIAELALAKVDGFQLTASIKGNEKYSDIPVILVTSLQSDVHRRRGLEVGADAYITKGSFDQNNLLDTIRRLI